MNGLYQRLRTWIRAHRFLYKSESNECRFMLACLRRGMTTIDIGAHKAAYTYWMSRLVGKSGKVFAFEPVPALAELLQQYSHLVPGRNLTVYPLALSNSSGMTHLKIPGEDYMWSTLNYDSAEIENQPVNYQYVTIKKDKLDDVLGKLDLREPVDFIKCDVEGHELAVFQGATRILKVDRPILLFESSPLDEIPATENQTMQLLSCLGYEGYFFAQDELLTIAHHDAAIHHRTTVGIQNFVFLHPARWTLINRQFPFAVQARGVRQNTTAA